MYAGCRKQKAWLSDQAFAEKYGFETVDTTPEGYRLLALSFDGTKPRFGKNAKVQAIENQKLTVYYTSQCPYIHQSVELVRKTCEELEAPCTPHPGGHSGEGQGLALRVQQLGGILSGKVRDGESAGRRRAGSGF